LSKNDNLSKGEYHFTKDLEIVNFEWLNIAVNGNDNMCMVVESNLKVVTGPCGVSNFAWANGLILYQGEKLMCITVNLVDGQVSLSDCKSAVEFTYQDLGFRVRSMPQYILEVKSDGQIIAFTSRGSIDKPTSTQKFSLKSQNAKTLIYSAINPGMCISADLTLKNCADGAGFTFNQNKLMGPTGDCIGTDDTIKLIFVDCAEALTFVYDADRKLFLNGERSAITARDNEIVLLTYDPENDSNQFVMDRKNVKYEYQYILNDIVAKHGDCAKIVDGELRVGKCFENDRDSFSFVNGQFIWKNDAGKCLSGATDTLPIKLVDCNDGGKFTYKDGVLALAKNEKFKMGLWGDENDPISMQLSPSANNTQIIALNLRDITIHVQSIVFWSEKEDHKCVTALGDKLGLTACPAPVAFARFSKRLISNETPQRCVKNLTLGPCVGADSFTFNRSKQLEFLLQDGESMLTVDKKGVFSMGKTYHTGDKDSKRTAFWRGAINNIEKDNQCYFSKGSITTCKGDLVCQNHAEGLAPPFGKCSPPPKEFHPLFSYSTAGKQGFCAKVVDGNLKVGKCFQNDRDYFAFVDGKFIWKNDTEKCLSGAADTSPIKLVDCYDGGNFTYKDGVLTLAENAQFKMGLWGDENDPISMQPNPPAAKTQSLRMHLRDIASFTQTYVFWESNDEPSCMTSSGNQLGLSMCPSRVQFAIFADRLITDEYPTRCVENLTLGACSSADLFTYNKNKKLEFRLLNGNQMLTVEIGGTFSMGNTYRIGDDYGSTVVDLTFKRTLFWRGAIDNIEFGGECFYHKDSKTKCVNGYVCRKNPKDSEPFVGICGRA
jgi:hypothetical protein